MKISTISLTDFRAFPGPAPVTFELGGKNLLVYGENGAGKSSLFHALRDFFTLDLSTNLIAYKNVFSGSPAEQCRVEVRFVAHEQDPAEWTVKRHPCFIDLDMKVQDIYSYFFAGADSRVLDAARSAIFLDYKSLLDTNYKNGTDEVNLFEVATTLLLREYLVTVPGGSESSLGMLWQQVLHAEKVAKSEKAPSSALTKVNQSCIEFNVALRQALVRALPEVNRILALLGWRDVVLKELQTPGVTYKNARFRRDRCIEGQRLIPVLDYRDHPLERPQMFLNEARLSGLALALYLGGRLACTPIGESQSLKLMVLDDVLVGLDHSNRLPVLDVLVDLFPTWQVVLLTHDKGWFDLARKRLPNGDWVCYEIFEGDQAGEAPMPIVRKIDERPAKALLTKGRELLELGYVEAAANYTRQAFEIAIRAASELKAISLPYKQDAKHYKAETLLDELKKWQGSKNVKKPDWDAALDRLDLLKNVVMNPYSHPNAPNIPKQEVVNAADAVDTFLELVRRK